MRVTRPRAFIALLMVTPIAIGAITVARQNAAAPAFDVVSVRKSSTLDCSGLGTTTIFAMNVATPQAPKDQPCGFMPADGPGRIIANGIEMATLAGNLAVSLGRPVPDTTRLDGRYDVDLSTPPRHSRPPDWLAAAQRLFPASTRMARRSPPRWPINWE